MIDPVLRDRLARDLYEIYRQHGPKSWTTEQREALADALAEKLIYRDQLERVGSYKPESRTPADAPPNSYYVHTAELYLNDIPWCEPVFRIRTAEHSAPSGARALGDET